MSLCQCSGGVLLRRGILSCATCFAPVALATAVAEYSTATPAEYPPRCRTRRAARDRIRQVPGHRREGTGRATVWIVAAEAYRAHCTRRREVPPSAPSNDVDGMADRALAAWRSTRKAG